MALTSTDIKLIKEAVRGDTLQIVNGAVDDAFGELANMVANGFAAVETRFDEVEKRLAGLDRDMAEVKYRLPDRVTRPEFLNLKQRVEILEDKAGTN